MKFATIEVNGCFRAVLAYDEIIAKEDDFTGDGQRVELFINHRLVAVVYGGISTPDHDGKVTDINHIGGITIDIAE